MTIDSLLASDMDGTVIPLDTKEKRKEEIQKFNTLIKNHPNILLAYVTGRHLELGLEGVSRFKLPFPDIFVCDVGTTIYHNKDGEWLLDKEFRSELAASWKGLSGADIAALLNDISVLTPQEDEKQKEFKQSYYTPVDADREGYCKEIIARFKPHGIKANIIYSLGVNKDIGLLDILPPNAAKDYALNYLWKNLKLNKERIVYAGDSGNDLLAFVSGFNAIVVNNTAETVKDAARSKARKKNIEQRVYFANGNCVQGVIEGCYHFNLFQE